MNLNLALRMERSRMRERKVEHDKPTKHPVPEVNEYHQHVLAIANDDALFRKLQKDMRNSQHSILGSRHAIHVIVQKYAKEAKGQTVETELVKLGGGEQEECNSTAGNRLHFFADLTAKSLSGDRQLLIETFRNILQRPPGGEEKEVTDGEGGNSTGSRQQFCAEFVNLRATLGGGEEEELTGEGVNSTGNRRQFFADLRAKSLPYRQGPQQPRIEVLRNSVKRGRPLRKILYMPPCA